MGHNCHLSIIVCTSERYQLLGECVESVLRDPSFDAACMELVVVDNTPPAKRIQCATPSEAMRVVLFDPPGLSAARNRGVDESCGEIVAFIDDDARIQGRWCATVLRAFALHPEAMICGGRTLIRHAGRQLPPWFYPELSQMLSALDLGRALRPICDDEWIVGTNMAVRREVFAEGRRFDEQLGRRPGSLLSNEESDLVAQVGRGRTYYVPEMLADHFVAEERLQRGWFLARAKAQAASDVISSLGPSDAKQARMELMARLGANPELAGSTERETDDPLEFREQVRIAYLAEFLASHGEQGSWPPPNFGLTERLWIQVYRLERLAFRLGLGGWLSRMRLAWREKAGSFFAR